MILFRCCKSWPPSSHFKKDTKLESLPFTLFPLFFLFGVNLERQFLLFSIQIIDGFKVLRSLSSLLTSSELLPAVPKQAPHRYPLHTFYLCFDLKRVFCIQSFCFPEQEQRQDVVLISSHKQHNSQAVKTSQKISGG